MHPSDRIPAPDEIARLFDAARALRAIGAKRGAQTGQMRLLADACEQAGDYLRLMSARAQAGRERG